MKYLATSFSSQLIAGVFLANLSVGLSHAQAIQLPSLTETPPYEYKVSIDGIPDEKLTELIQLSSRLQQLQDKPPSSLAALKRRAREDEEGFNKVLRSEGFYDNAVAFNLDETKTPIDIAYNIEPGPQFRLSSFQVKTTRGHALPQTITLDTLGIKIGMNARSQAIIDAQNKLIVQLANTGFPEAKLSDQEAIVDFELESMEVTLTIDEGPYLIMGDLVFEGLTEVDPQHLYRLAEWQKGQQYNAETIDKLRRKFLRTGLFEAVRLKPRANPDNMGSADGTVPITLVFIERDHRSIGFGASFSTSEGAGTEFFWENRNLFDNGEKLRADLTVAEIRRQLNVTFVKPHYGRLEQNLTADLNIKQEQTDAFDENSVAAFVGLDRPWQENWTVGAGLSFEFAQIEDTESEESYALAGLPLTARYDSTDDLLDPSQGFRVSTKVVPYLGLNEVTPNFLRNEIDGSTYYSVLDDNRLVLAARGKLGLMAGDTASDIPASKRFYSGGGGSIRGYKHQTVGPLNDSDDPVGGRSLIEVGLEARTKITEDIGLVPFIEGGNVYDSMVPDFSENFQWGAGLGLRYYTAIGPIRFDVAVPLNHRKDIDDAVQFYVSIGQAF
ncbi:autotransporter assembly complex protein TamA [Kiloniella laminariae]|uniref:autotransporter assembly complex protein TamA n=1 Tax=Kiloniella laminariae TaxID=454162 RepID=UPI0003602611|nr:autotransporter assembly complex family protein [Kiloniella laminariae]